MRHVVIAVLALAGCGKIFGIDTIDYAGPPPSSDGRGSSSDALGSDGSDAAMTTLEIDLVDAGATKKFTMVGQGFSCNDPTCMVMVPDGVELTVNVSVGTGDVVLAWTGACLGINKIGSDMFPDVGCAFTPNGPTRVGVVAGDASQFHIVTMPIASVVDANSTVGIQNFTGDLCRAGDVCAFYLPNQPLNFNAVTNASAGCTVFKAFNPALSTNGNIHGGTIKPNSKLLTEAYAWELASGADPGCLTAF
ncbi:MAG: hypothetical protein QM831_00515 [Kofleriaceae bacterium]